MNKMKLKIMGKKDAMKVFKLLFVLNCLSRKFQVQEW